MNKSYIGGTMLADTRDMVSLTEANRNFSRVARLVDERGPVVILRNNQPRYVVIDYAQLNAETAADDDCRWWCGVWVAAPGRGV